MLNLSSTSTTLSSFSYVLDAVGNRQRVVESTGNRVTWTYDKTYQLTNEQRSGSNGYNITYTYDPVGNRLVLINGGVRTTSSYDTTNALTRSKVVARLHRPIPPTRTAICSPAAVHRSRSRPIPGTSRIA